MIAKTRC